MIADFIFLFETSPALRAGLFFCLGACIGSFATALMHRIPRKLNWATDRSRCPCCNHVLGAQDLVPVFSWVFLKGKCRYCHVRISPRYPLTETVFGIIFAVCGVFILN